MTFTARRRARRERRILAALPPVPVRATEDEMRSPDWCHSHNCHRSACQH
ncbi:hypothetical protein ACFRQM_04425 [Streptomyces sp. NPDC056831]